MSNDLLLPDTNQEGLDAVSRAKAIAINSREEYIAADMFCVGLKELEKKVDAAYDEHISTAFKAHRSLVAKKNSFAQPILEARKIVKAKLVSWQDYEEEMRKKEEIKQQSEAKKRADDEAIAYAQQAHADGDNAEAERILNAPIEVPVIVVPNNTTKTATTIQTRWDYRVTDMAIVPREYLMLDTTKIGQVVRALKNEARIPGIEAYSKKI